MACKVISFMECKLSELDPPAAACITGLTVTGAMRRRLQDLGFVPGAHVRLLYKGHRGGICAYAVGGSVIALRCPDAANIMVIQ